MVVVVVVSFPATTTRKNHSPCRCDSELERRCDDYVWVVVVWVVGCLHHSAVRLVPLLRD